jgi:hypothetical protein
MLRASSWLKTTIAQELLSSRGIAMAKALIEKGVVTQQEFLQKIGEERAV